MLDIAQGDRFEIRREIGKGGMGKVYEALDRDRNALVALKTLHQASPSAIARFKAEFRSLAGLVHPNLVTLYELVVSSERAFYTMELVDGVHFDRWVRPRVDPEPLVPEPPSETEVTRPVSDTASSSPSTPDRGRLDLRRLRRAMRQLAEGITAIHDAGKLHRDLKPSNVMVTSSGRVIILDFGLVADLELEAGDRRVLEGTASYMSPEQGARARLTQASDWYALGVILYRALTGRMPFIGGRDDVLMDKQRYEPARPSEVAGDVPADLDTLCVELLRRDPHRRPNGTDVLRRLGSKLAAAREPITYSTATGAGSEILVGRARELEFLDQAWRASLEGQPVLLHVRGRSGMGKSRVVNAFLADIGRHQQEIVVLRGRCYEAESLPFKAIDSLIDALARHLAALEPIEVEGLMPRDAMALARVFPVLRQVSAFTSERRREVRAPDPQELRRRAFAALRELFGRLSDRDPLVLAIDDVQWGDLDSAELLSSLVRPPDAPPIFLLMCWRSEAADESTFLGSLRARLTGQRVDVRELAIGRLSDDHTRELAMIHLGPRNGAADLAARIAAESGGSPFFVEEMARHVRDVRGAPDVSLADALRHRVTRLPDDAALLLSTIAVAGCPIPQSVAIRAAGVNDPAVMSLLKAGSFVQPRTVDGARYVEVYHDRIRETALAELDEAALRERHLRLAHMFEASARPDPEVLAAHYAGAGELERAADFAVEAARRAREALAFERAASMFRSALAWSPGTVDRTVRIELGDALVWAGRGAEAAEAFESAIDGAPKAEALDLRCRAANQLLYSGRVEDGLARLTNVLDEVGMKLAATPRRAMLSFAWNRLMLRLRGLGYREREVREVPASRLMEVDVTFAVTEGLGFSDPIRGADFHGRSVLLALGCGEPSRVHRAIAAEAVFVSLRGTGTERRVGVLLDHMSALTETLGTSAARALDVGIRGLCAFNLGRFAECIDLCAQAELVYRDECVGFRFERGTAQLYQCFAMALGGHVRDMMRKFPQLVKEAYDRGDLFLATNLRVALGMYVPLMEDDSEGAYREVESAMASWPQEGFHLPHCNAMSTMAYIDMYRGEGTVAYRRVEAAWPALVGSKLLMVQIMRALSWSCRGRAALCAYRATGDREALAIARRARRVLMREKVGYCTSMGLVIDAGLAYVAGDHDGALARLQRAETESEEAGALLHARATRWSRGFILGGDEGAELRRTAGAMFRAEGAVHPEGVARIFAPVADF